MAPTGGPLFASGSQPPFVEGQPRPATRTGRHIVTLQRGTAANAASALYETAGLRIRRAPDITESVIAAENAGDSSALLLEHLDIAIVNGDSDQIGALTLGISDDASPIVAVEPEVVVTHHEVNTWTKQQTVLASTSEFGDTQLFTWGLQAIAASVSPYTGRAIRVAILDTGLDLNHPDFAGREILAKSFTGEPVDDRHGHGTHCAGIACGPRTPRSGVRGYGIACDASILVGKVLDNLGAGTSGRVLEGINWAIANDAAIISMSLGSPDAVAPAYSASYEQAAQVSLGRGCLIVASAGNAGNQPVDSPASCPSVLAVAAVDAALKRAPFSCIGLNLNGGEVSVAAPGVNVFSAAPMPDQYRIRSGTSMATPHVAGCAALYAQASGERGMGLWRIVEGATQLIEGETRQSVGSGLVRAP